jgi:hypothetical protein
MISPSWHPSRRELRQFGIAAFFAFGILGAILRYHFELTTAPWIIWGLASVCGIGGIVAPFKVYPLYLLVTLIALPIGLIVSNLVLGLIYYGIMTPLGWILRLTGRDPLRLAKRDRATYWMRRTGKPDPASYYRQS